MPRGSNARPPHALGDVFALLAEHSDDLLCIADTKAARFRWLSPGWVKALGWTEAELLGRPYPEFVHPDDPQDATAAAESSSGADTPLFFENRYRHKDGHWVWLQWSALSHPEGISYCWARDISRTKDIEQREREQAKLLELSAEIAQVGHWRIDLQTERLTWSDEVYRIHGLDPAVHTPTTASAIAAYHPDDRERVANCVAAAIEKREPFDFELRLIRADGAIRQVVSKGRVEIDHRDQPTAVFGIFQDVTEARTMERKLRQAERMSSLGTLAAGLAHELNNPLTYVFGHLDTLQQELQRPEHLALVAELIQGAEHMRDVIAGLGAFARGGVQEMHPTSLADVIDVALQVCRHQLLHHGTLTVESASSLPPVHGNRTGLAQVVVNLLINAARALPDGGAGGHIQLRTGASDTRAFIEVEDNGVGISSEIQGRILEPFFTTREVGEGMGLGLSICHGIVSNHGGTLEVESRPGRTVFRVELPLSLPSRGSEAQGPSGPQSTQRLRVLVVDDDARVATVIGHGLKTVAEVMVATSGQQALDLLGQSSFDVIVCDVMMPEMAGWQVRQHVARLRPELQDRILFMTGGAFNDEAVAFVASLPEELVLRKPFRTDILCNAVVALAVREPPEP